MQSHTPPPPQSTTVSPLDCAYAARVWSGKKLYWDPKKEENTGAARLGKILPGPFADWSFRRLAIFGRRTARKTSGSRHRRISVIFEGRRRFTRIPVHLDERFSSLLIYGNVSRNDEIIIIDNVTRSLLLYALSGPFYAKRLGFVCSVFFWFGLSPILLAPSRNKQMMVGLQSMGRGKVVKRRPKRSRG